MPDPFVTLKSTIAGKGSFATREIKKGTRICKMQGKKYSLEEILKLIEEKKEEGSDPLGYDDERYIDLKEKYRTSITHAIQTHTSEERMTL